MTPNELELEEDILILRRLEKKARLYRRNYYLINEPRSAKTWGFIVKCVYSARVAIERERN